jgi:hypothetical protein
MSLQWIGPAEYVLNSYRVSRCPVLLLVWAIVPNAKGGLPPVEKIEEVTLQSSIRPDSSGGVRNLDMAVRNRVKNDNPYSQRSNECFNPAIHFTEKLLNDSVLDEEVQQPFFFKGKNLYSCDNNTSVLSPR